MGGTVAEETVKTVYTENSHRPVHCGKRPVTLAVTFVHLLSFVCVYKMDIGCNICLTCEFCVCVCVFTKCTRSLPIKTEARVTPSVITPALRHIHTQPVAAQTGDNRWCCLLS